MSVGACETFTIHQPKSFSAREERRRWQQRMRWDKSNKVAWSAAFFYFLCSHLKLIMYTSHRDGKWRTSIRFPLFDSWRGLFHVICNYFAWGLIKPFFCSRKVCENAVSRRCLVFFSKICWSELSSKLGRINCEAAMIRLFEFAFLCHAFPSTKIPSCLLDYSKHTKQGSFSHNTKLWCALIKACHQ